MDKQTQVDGAVGSDGGGSQNGGQDRCMSVREALACLFIDAQATYEQYELSGTVPIPTQGQLRTFERITQCVRDNNILIPDTWRSPWPNPCEKIFDHKYLSPDCVERGCKALTLELQISKLQAALSEIEKIEVGGHQGEALGALAYTIKLAAETLENSSSKAQKTSDEVHTELERLRQIEKDFKAQSDDSRVCVSLYPPELAASPAQAPGLSNTEGTADQSDSTNNPTVSEEANRS